MYKMKESGVPWIGMIPENWEMIPNKRLFIKRQEKVGENSGDYQLLSLTTSGVKEKDITDVKGKVPASYDGYQEVKQDDMIFCLFDLDISAVFSGVSPYEGMITSAYDVAKCNGNYILPKYADYWFNAVFSKRHYRVYAKNVRYTISYDLFGMLKSPVPSLDEQEQIVRFLDWKTSQVNRLINIKRQQIQDLTEIKKAVIEKAVYSGLENAKRIKKSIPCVESVPENWDIRRIKYLFDLRDERNYRPLEEVNLISLYTKFGVVQNKDVEYASGNHARTAEGYKIVYEDDIIVNIILCWMGAIGRCAYNGVTSPAYDVYKPHSDVSSRYYHYLFRTPAFSGECYKAGKGIMAMRWRTYSPQFKSIIVPFPPFKEQEEIADYLDEKCKTIDERIDISREQIELLKEIRSSFICDATTGKLDIRNVDIPYYEFVAEQLDDVTNDESDSDEFEEQED